MNIFRRVNDIISANLNDLIDRFEDPEAMLRQAIREMEAAIDDSMHAAAQVIAEERLLTRQLDELHRSSERLRDRAAAAVQRGEDSVARSALSQKAEHDKLIAALDDQLQSAGRHSAKLRRQVAAMRVRLGEARHKLQTYIARDRAAAARRQFAGDALHLTHADAAFSRFDTLCRTVERREAEAEAYEELAGAPHLTGLTEEDPNIELELQTLKQQLAT